MEFADIIDMMLALITDYGVADMSDEELQADVAVRVNMVIVRAQIPNLAYEDGALTRSATVLEATIIAYGLLMMWLSPFINNSEVLSTQLASKEVTQFSNANRIQQGIALYRLAKSEFYQLVIDYDSLQQKADILEELGDGS